jgi:hypothetical protein
VEVRVVFMHTNVGATHVGAFREWKEDFETVEIFLPLPPATTKSELVCVITPDSLHIRHTRLQASLLVAQPLAGPVIPEDSTWYLEGGVFNLVLAKQWRGETKSDQYWGAQLAAKGGAHECYMPPAEVRAAKQAREREEAELTQERHARIKKADAAARATKAAEVAEAAEAAAEAAARQRSAQAAALQAARRRRAAGPLGDDRRSDALRDGDTRKPRPRALVTARRLRKRRKSGSLLAPPAWRLRPAAISPHQCGFSVGSGRGAPPRLRARPVLPPRTRRHAVRLGAPKTDERRLTPAGGPRAWTGGYSPSCSSSCSGCSCGHSRRGAYSASFVARAPRRRRAAG